MPENPLGHVPPNAAASKALAAGGASRKGRPSPFHRALQHPDLPYSAWWHLTTHRVRTAATAQKCFEAEKARLKTGLRTNDYGDVLSHEHGHLTQERGVGKYAHTVTKLHGFRKHRRRFFPDKSTWHLTSPWLDALHRVLMLNEEITRQDHQAKEATKAGFISPSAHWKWLKKHESALHDARNQGWHEGYERGRQSMLQEEAFADLNDYGIAPKRDLINGPCLTLVNFSSNRRKTVSLVAFMSLTGSKIERRNNGWRLSDYTAPVVTPPPSFHLLTRLQTHPTRKIDPESPSCEAAA
jgi:hypothetical protein